MKRYAMLIAIVLNVITVHAMDDDHDDTQLAAAAVEISPVAKVNAWKALSDSEKWDISKTLWRLVEEYNQQAVQNGQVPLTNAKDDDISLGEINAVVVRADRDLRHDVRDKGAKLPTTEAEFQKYLEPCIAWVRAVPGRTNRDISDISDTSTESLSEFNGDDDWDVEKQDDGTTIMLIRKENE
jgi:hypothetical protein